MQRESLGMHNHRGKTKPGHTTKAAICNLRGASGETGSAGTLSSEFWPPDLLGNTFLLWKSPSVWYLVMAAQANQCNTVI